MSEKTTLVKIPCGCEIVEELEDRSGTAFLRIEGCEEHPLAQGVKKGNAWAFVNYIKQLEAKIAVVGKKFEPYIQMNWRIHELEAENKTYKHEVSVLRQLLDDDGTIALEAIEQQEGEILALREYATHKPGCHEGGDDCICGLDALLADTQDCKHPNAVSAVNEVIESDMYCPDCNSFFADTQEVDFDFRIEDASAESLNDPEAPLNPSPKVVDDD